MIFIIATTSLVHLLILDWIAVTSVLYPVIWILSEILYAPVRIVLGLSGVLGFIFTRIHHMVGHISLFVSSLFKFASGAEATVRTVEVSVWRSLWNDLFSKVDLYTQLFGKEGIFFFLFVLLTKFSFSFQVFRALRSILYGLSAFFTACNRHRLRFLLCLLFCITTYTPSVSC